MDSPSHDTALQETTPHYESQPYFFKMYELMKNVMHRDVRNECKEGFILTWPISLSMVLIFMIPILTLIFIGHYHHSHLAAVGLAFSFSILFGLSLVSGFASTCITLATPAFAAGNKKLAGIALQKTFGLSVILMFPLTGLWVNSGKIFNLLRQGEEISSTAQEFLIYYLPALLLQNTHAILHRFLASQSIVLPSIWCVFPGLVLHLVFTYTLLFLLDLGVKGAAIAADITWFLVNLILLLYMKYSGLLAWSWPGASTAWLLDWGKFFWLALPSIAMLFIEIAAFQYGTFFLGSISNRELEIHIIFYYVALIMFANAHGISNAASVRVGSVLAVGDQRTLKIAIKAQLFNVCFVCCSFGFLLMVIKDVIGYLFTNRSDIVTSASHGIPVLACFIVLDGVQVVLGGVLQGAGLQRYSAAVNLIGYIVIAIPVGSVIATSGMLGTLGYWIGLTCGAVAQVLILSLILWNADFKKRSRKARRRAGIFDDVAEDDDVSEMQTFTRLPQRRAEEENIEEDVNAETLTSVSDDQFFVDTDTEASLTKSLIFRRVILLVASVCSLVLGIVFAMKPS